jgi:hypothetical protein
MIGVFVGFHACINKMHDLRNKKWTYCVISSDHGVLQCSDLPSNKPQTLPLDFTLMESHLNCGSLEGGKIISQR